MENERKPNGYWTKERCIEDAKKYKTRSEWHMKSKGAYESACRNKWLDECCSHMEDRFVWTKERCIEDAKKYKTRSEWRKKTKSAYHAAFKKDWLDECCSHMVSNRKPEDYWTKERCIEDAKKYKTKSEWIENSKGAYSAAFRNGWIDKCSEHMIKRFVWTKELCIEDARKYESKSEWSMKSKGAYQKALKKNWLGECCSHMVSNRKPEGYWTKERCIEDAKKYKTRSKWQKKSVGAYHKAFEKNWLGECCSHMVSNRKLKGYWTKERCIEDAKKYNTKTEWRKKSGGAYISAHRNKWLDDCCEHIKTNKFLTHECTL